MLMYAAIAAVILFMLFKVVKGEWFPYVKCKVECVLRDKDCKAC